MAKVTAMMDADTEKLVLKALRRAERALGAHGPCTNNSCKDCGEAFFTVLHALMMLEGGEE